jgi:hypothetical protein
VLLAGALTVEPLAAQEGLPAPEPGTGIGEPAVAQVDNAPARPGERRRRAAPTQPSLDLGDGKLVRLSFDAVDGIELAVAADQLPSGAILPIVHGRALKLLTDRDLQFGDQRIKAGNIADNYPGAYSLWIARSGDGWTLTFNQYPDVWGTMHDASADAATVPLVHEQTGTPVDKLTLELTGAAGSGHLAIQAGTHRWIATFDAVED